MANTELEVAQEAIAKLGGEEKNMEKADALFRVLYHHPRANGGTLAVLRMFMDFDAPPLPTNEEKQEFGKRAEEIITRERAIWRQSVIAVTGEDPENQDEYGNPEFRW